MKETSKSIISKHYSEMSKNRTPEQIKGGFKDPEVQKRALETRIKNAKTRKALKGRKATKGKTSTKV